MRRLDTKKSRFEGLQLPMVIAVLMIALLMYGSPEGYLEFPSITRGTKRDVIVSGDGDGEPMTQYPTKTVALTFDDGPHPIYTKQLLDGLRTRNIKVTFFLIGNNIDGNEAVVRQMSQDGHLIGNHSLTHLQMTREKKEKVCAEINLTNQKIYEITGQMPSYIRPPFGSWSEELACMIPMTVALWDLDPLDWKNQNASKTVRHILRNVEDGSIILLHDVYETSVDAALEVIDTLVRRGYNFVTVDELIID